MTFTKYKYALVDMSYLLMRNMFAASIGKDIGEYTAGDVIRITLQTINKIPRDYGITADKFIFIYDKWDKSLGGYYRTHLLKGEYKSDREYVTIDTVNRLKEDPNSTPEQIRTAEVKAYANQVKYEAKWGMINDFKNHGLPCIGLEGWEYDDLAWLAACLLYGETDGKPSIFITKDSDLQYSLTPEMDYFKLPTRGSLPETITYSQMCNTIPEKLKTRLSLYEYKSLLDSLGEGHNGMAKTKARGKKAEDVISKILDGDFSDVKDKELFDKQLYSFDLSHFPKLDIAKELILTQFDSIGRLGDLDDFHAFCGKHNVTGITDTYYTEFINRFDPKLFTEL